MDFNEIRYGKRQQTKLGLVNVLRLLKRTTRGKDILQLVSRNENKN